MKTIGLCLWFAVFFSLGWLACDLSQPEVTTFGEVLEKATKQGGTIYIGPGTYSEDTPVIVLGGD